MRNEVGFLWLLGYSSLEMWKWLWLCCALFPDAL